MFFESSFLVIVCVFPTKTLDRKSTKKTQKLNYINWYRSSFQKQIDVAKSLPANESIHVLSLYRYRLSKKDELIFTSSLNGGRNSELILVIYMNYLDITIRIIPISGWCKKRYKFYCHYMPNIELSLLLNILH